MKNTEINAWEKYDEAGVKEIFAFNEGYKDFMSRCKTERECVKEAITLAEAKGYRNLDEVIKNGETLKAGDKVYANNMGKAIALYHIGEKPLEDGLKILGAHLDSPRLDLKQNPLYEDSELAFFRYTLLWWNKEISMGNITFGYPWSCSKERWN